MVVLQEDVRRLGVAPRFLDHGIGDRLVDRHVSVVPRVVDGAPNVRRPRCVPHEVLHEPEERVAEDVVVPLINGRRHRHEAHEDVLLGHLERLAVRLRCRDAVAVRHRRGDPRGRHEARRGRYRRNHAAAAPLRRKLAAGLELVLDRSAVARDDEAAPREHLGTESLEALEVLLGGRGCGSVVHGSRVASPSVEKLSTFALKGASRRTYSGDRLPP